jgi:hypothetical protein
MSTLTLDQQKQQQNALRTHQSRYDEVLRQVGAAAVVLMSGQFYRPVMGRLRVALSE